jgi:hypothetical protein
LALAERQFGPDSAEIVATLNNLARLYRPQGRYGEAELLYKRSVVILERVCDKKLIEFTRFTYIGSSSMTESWKAARASEWNAFHCNNPLWNDAIANGWTVLLNVSSVDGGRASFKMQCQ